MLKIYLDVCCLNRPFDDWKQDRIRLEAEAIIQIIKRVVYGKWQLISSEAVEAELEKMNNFEKLEKIVKLTELATMIVKLDERINQRSQVLEGLGFGLYDSFHIACAEIAQAEVLLTTDDRLLRRANSSTNLLQVKINNPVTWLMEILQLEGEDNYDPN